MKNGEVRLFNTFVDIDGDSELGDTTLVCHLIYLKGDWI